MRIAALLVCIAAVACGNPDNLVVGGFNDTANSGVIISTVRSAIHGDASVKLRSGETVQLSVIAMSDSPNLCDKVAQHVDFFQTPSETSTTLLMFTPHGMIGDFFIGQQNT